MNITRLRRALESGNRVVYFDKVRDPLRPGSRILYESIRGFCQVRGPAGILEVPTEAELAALVPLGVKAVIVPDPDQLPGEV